MLKKTFKILIFIALFSVVAINIYQKLPKYFRRNQDNCAKIKYEIDKYDWNKDIAFAIAKAESNCDPMARGDEKLTFKGCYNDHELSLDAKEPFKNYTEYNCSEQEKRTYGYSVGAFQIRILPGRLECDTYNIETNVKCAYRVYQEKNNSFAPWSVYNDGKYKNYLQK